MGTRKEMGEGKGQWMRNDIKKKDTEKVRESLNDSRGTRERNKDRRRGEGVGRAKAT